MNTKISKESSTALGEFIGNRKGIEGFKEVFAQLSKSVIEKMLESEMEEHLGYIKHANSPSDN